MRASVCRVCMSAHTCVYTYMGGYVCVVCAVSLYAYVCMYVWLCMRSCGRVCVHVGGCVFGTCRVSAHVHVYDIWLCMDANVCVVCVTRDTIILKHYNA